MPFVPNLDDTSMQEMLDRGFQQLKKIFPQWQDHSPHDPGVTLFELLVWLTGLQRFYQDQVPPEHLLKFLRLLGVQPTQPTMAKTLLGAIPLTSPTWVYQGTKFEIGNQTFECDGHFQITPRRVLDVWVDGLIANKRVTKLNSLKEQHAFFYPFDEKPLYQHALRIELSTPIIAGETCILNVLVKNPIPIDPLAYDPPSGLIWHLGYPGYPGDGSGGGGGEGGGEAGSGEGAITWIEVQPKGDTTYSFRASGDIHFEIPDHGPGAQPALAPITWIKCTVGVRALDYVPRVASINTNRFWVHHRDTLIACHDYTLEETADQLMVPITALMLTGQTTAQLWRGTYWSDVGPLYTPSITRVTMENGVEMLAVRLVDGAGQGLMLPKGARVRFVNNYPEVEPYRLIGSGTGLPYQVIETDLTGIWRPEFLLQVAEPVGYGAIGWFDWVWVDALMDYGPCDRVFTMDLKSGRLVFGNGDQGRVVPAGAANIRLSALVLGGGTQGNVRAGVLSGAYGYGPDLPWQGIDNRTDAAGGGDGQTLEQALDALQELRLKPWQAHQARDLEALALATPNVRATRARALPLYNPSAGTSSAKGFISLVVLSDNGDLPMAASPAFFHAIHSFVDQRMLMGTKLRCIPPIFVGIKVDLYTRDPISSGQRDQLKQRLKAFLSPYGSAPSGGWPFGGTIRKSALVQEILSWGIIHTLPACYIVATGSKARYINQFDVVLPPEGLPYLEDMTLNQSPMTDPYEV